MKFLILLLIPVLSFAQVKISELPAVTSPTSSDTLLILNDGATKKVTVANLMKTLVAALNGTSITGTTVTATQMLVKAQTANLGPSASTNLYVSGLDATTNSLFMDAYAGQNSVSFRRANGTASSPTALLTGDAIGTVNAFGYGATGVVFGSKVQIVFEATENWTDTSAGTRIRFTTTPKGTATVANALHIGDDQSIAIALTLASKSAAATLTAAEVRGGLIQYTGAVANLQMPTGTDLQNAMGTTQSTNMTTEFTVINTGSGVATLTVNTGVTFIGAVTITNGTSATFYARRTGTNTFVVYRK